MASRPYGEGELRDEASRAVDSARLIKGGAGYVNPEHPELNDSGKEVLPRLKLTDAQLDKANKENLTRDKLSRLANPENYFESDRTRERAILKVMLEYPIGAEVLFRDLFFKAENRKNVRYNELHFLQELNRLLVEWAYPYTLEIKPSSRQGDYKVKFIN